MLLLDRKLVSSRTPSFGSSRRTDCSVAAFIRAVGACFVLTLAVCGGLQADEHQPVVPEFGSDVKAKLEAHCYDCHNTAEEKGGLDLQVLTRELDFRSRPSLLGDLEWVLQEHEMPPSGYEKQLNEEDRRQLLAWIRNTLLELQNARPNDPGEVVSPRINSAEYDYVIRDLTGAAMNVGQYLTADAPGGEGFLNMGANLTLSVGQFESFLAAAKLVVNHARIGVDTGPVFFSFPVGKAEDNEAFAESLLELYMMPMMEAFEQWAEAKREALHTHIGKKEFDKDEANWIAWLEAAWQYRYRDQLGMPEATLAEVGENYPVSLPRSGMQKLWAVLTSDTSGGEELDKVESLIESGLMQKLVERWKQLPPPNGADKNSVREQIASDVRWVMSCEVPDYGGSTTRIEYDYKDDPSFTLKDLRGRYRRGVFPIDLHIDRSETGYVYFAVSTLWDGREGDYVRVSDMQVEFEDGRVQPLHEIISSFESSAGRPVKFGNRIGKATPPADSVTIPGGHWVRFSVPDGAVGLKAQGAIDPDIGDDTTSQWLATDRQPDNMETFHRRYVLGNLTHDRAKRFQQMTQLATGATETAGRARDEQVFWTLSDRLQSALGVDRVSRFRSYRGENLIVIDGSEIIDRMDPQQHAMLAKVLALMEDFAKYKDAPANQTEQQARRIIDSFATKAWRRQVNDKDLQKLFELYKQERARGATFENAMQQPLVATLLSPRFLYRFVASKGTAEPYALSSRELAERLSFMLWGSLPDEELLDVAADGRLQEPDVMREQVQRMIQDERFEGFIEQFAAHWLGFADYEVKADPDQEKYSFFSAELKRDLQREVVQFLRNLFQENGSLLSLLDAQHSFLNERLAKFYGVSGVDGEAFRKVVLPADSNRGGLLGMAAFHAMTSTPLRTSPVHRGLWVYQVLLGKPVPEPPPNVPQLSDDEVSEEGLTVAQQLRKHRQDPTCYSCHDRFDPLGIALENFDPVGRWRSEVAPGKPVDSVGVYRDGGQIQGMAGLRQAVLAEKEAFVDNFARKLIGYGLSRGYLLSDQPLHDEIRQLLAENDFRPLPAILAIVNSDQFRTRRDAGAVESDVSAAR